MMGSKFFRGGALVLSVALAPFAAVALSFSGTDDNVQFDAYGSTGGAGTPGVFTFYDVDDVAPSRGTVTGEDGISGLAGGQVDFQMLLDLSGGYDPAADRLTDAAFTGTGGSELIIWDSTGTSALLVFDVSFVNVRNANGLGGSNNISFGDPEGSETRVDSEVTLIGGDTAIVAAAGGIGHQGTIDIQWSPTPGLPGGFGAFSGGYAGFLDDSATGGVTWSVTMTPEPGTGLLLGSALVALGVHGRRRRRR